MSKILLLNGPNINLLGTRQPEIYGAQSLEQLIADLKHQATLKGHELDHLQTNAEHLLIEAVQNAPIAGCQFLIINPGAYGHTSIALRDAVLAVKLPMIEVHLSNIYARESFRHCSYLTDISIGNIQGFGGLGYKLALEAADHFLSQTNRS